MPSGRADDFIRVARRLGFRCTRQTGSHQRWIHPDGRAVTIPLHGGREIGPPLFHDILRQLGISVEDFQRTRDRGHTMVTLHRRPMTASSNPQGSPASRYFPLLLLLFAGSGCSALIYEIVWYQMLQLAIGSTAVSLGILLATFMGGLCLGSLGLPRLRLARRHPLRVYAGSGSWASAGFGILVLVGLPLIDRVYIAGAEHGLPGMLLRGFISAVCLLPPTMLMGASLPAIVRWVEVHAARRGLVGPALRRQHRGRRLRLPVGRILPAAALQHGGRPPCAAAAINLAVAAGSFCWPAASRPRHARRSRARCRAEPSSRAAPGCHGRWTVYVTIALSGACALGAEVVWTRLLGMLLGATVYVFSIILAVFLIGLALGSSAGSWIAAHRCKVRARPAWRWAGARSCSPPASPGPPT